ncbi:unnamed protein product [Brachionus calyciflorus]|uniref:Uncharacterized protein n=1 Tax=Brachionus calyciflorus TaxID=104777 RepID=A0A814RS61_9BILA|nr:unnamed protein product [Brachionus calyciflorus]
MAPKVAKVSRKVSKKKNETVSSEDSSESEVHEREELKKNSKQKPKEDEIEIIPIIYEIPDEKHPFFHLNKVHASVDISKICERMDMEEV